MQGTQKMKMHCPFGALNLSVPPNGKYCIKVRDFYPQFFYNALLSHSLETLHQAVSIK